MDNLWIGRSDVHWNEVSVGPSPPLCTSALCVPCIRVRADSSPSLAIIELKMILATLLYQYKIDLDPASDPTDMEALLGVVIRPKNERCYLKFSKLPHVSP